MALGVCCIITLRDRHACAVDPSHRRAKDVMHSGSDVLPSRDPRVTLQAGAQIVRW